jgi:hypothetical protein
LSNGPSPSDIFGAVVRWTFRLIFAYTNCLDGRTDE